MQDDFADSAALWGDPEVTRFIGGRPFTQEEVWSRLLRYAGHWALLGYGFWTVREQTSGAFVGEVGLLNAMRDLTPPIVGPEVGWALVPGAQGQGYATEAVRAALAWAGTHLGTRMDVQTLSCIIGPDNTASLRVAQRCGFQETDRPMYHGEAVIRLTCVLSVEGH